MRILFLTHPGANSRDIFFDIIEGYQDAGHDVFILELAPLWNARHEHDGTANELTAILKFSNVLWSHNAASPRSFMPHPDMDKDFDIVFGVGADQVEPTLPEVTGH